MSTPTPEITQLQTPSPATYHSVGHKGKEDSRQQLTKLLAMLEVLKEQLTNTQEQTHNLGQVNPAVAVPANNGSNTANAAPVPKGMENFMLALMEALQKDQATESTMELTDASTTENDTKLLTSAYTAWNTQLQAAATKIEGASGTALSQDQGAYNILNAKAQTAENQGNSMVQSMQGQTSADGQNLATQVSGSNPVISIMTALSGVLAQGIIA